MEGTDHFSLRPQANAAFADPRYHGRQGCRTKAVALANSLAGYRNYRRPSPAKPRRGNPLSRHVRCKNPHHGGKIRRQRDRRAAQGRGAGKLNRQTVHSIIRWIRFKHRIPSPSRPAGTLTVSQVRERYGVSLWVVHYWIERGVVSAAQRKPNTPYAITIDDAADRRLREWVAHSGHLHPQSPTQTV